MANLTIQWSDNSTSTLTDVQEYTPAPIEAPAEDRDHTGKPIYTVTPARGYVYSLGFNIPHHICSSTIVTNFESHNRDLSKKVRVFDPYGYRVYEGFIKGIPGEFYGRLFPTQNRRMGIAIGVEREGTYTGTAGSGASITWRN